MAAVAETIRRVVGTAFRPRGSSVKAEFRLLRTEEEWTRTAFLLAHHGEGHVAEVHDLLAGLWALNTTALHIQIDNARAPADLVVERHSGNEIVASGQWFRAATATREPAPTGAYLTERQYRQLGHYQVPPAEQVIVALRISGSAPVYFVDVPHYVSHVAACAGSTVLASRAVVPDHGDLRYRLQSRKRFHHPGTVHLEGNP